MTSLFRIHPQPAFNFDGLVIDNFAGGGGASTGIELGLGRPVDIAINHDPEAIAMHEINHPHTRHYCESVWDVDPRAITGDRPVDLCWFSPDCKHFSKAKGGTPVSKKVRGLAWVAIRYAATVRPRVIMLENVEEFVTWGPITSDGRPCPRNKGRTFASFTNALRRLGYQVDWRELRACDYGAPTIRKRLFLTSRRDGLPLVWPQPTHGDPNSDAVKRKLLKPWRTAAEIIDWSIPCPSIFGRQRPLAENTLRRIARGLQRYVLDARHPFIAPAHSAGVLNPHGTPPGQLVVAAFLAKHYGGNYNGPGVSLAEPLPTVTTVDHNALVTSHLIKLRGTCRDGQPLDEPLHTVTTKDRMALVMIKGEPYQIVDIGMRMLEPHELYAAQGFPADYIHTHTAGGKRLSKAAQVRMCGNSVCPPVAAALVRANLVEQQQIEEAA